MERARHKDLIAEDPRHRRPGFKPSSLMATRFKLRFACGFAGHRATTPDAGIGRCSEGVIFSGGLALPGGHSSGQLSMTRHRPDLEWAALHQDERATSSASNSMGSTTSQVYEAERHWLGRETWVFAGSASPWPAVQGRVCSSRRTRQPQFDHAARSTPAPAFTTRSTSKPPGVQSVRRCVKRAHPMHIASFGPRHRTAPVEIP